MLFWMSVAFAWEPIGTCTNGDYLVWNSDPHWEMHDQFAGGHSFSTTLDDTEVLAAITSGFDVWTTPATCCSDFGHVYDGASTATPSFGDGTNTITFEESDWPAALGSELTTIAVTRTSFVGCVIDEVDQIYNGEQFTFTTNGSSGVYQADLQSIAAHENGHWLGLTHSPINGTTMYASYNGGTGARSLHPDDDAGVCALYPSNCGPTEVCNDGLDNDADGAIDCADAACAGDASCICPVTSPLICNTTITSTTIGGSDTVQTWGCASWQSVGNEAVYRFTPGLDGIATVTLSPLSADLDLFVTPEVSGTCDTEVCVSEGNPNLSEEVVSINVTAGTPYVIVADGWGGSQGDFELHVDCPGGVDGSVASTPDADADTDVDTDSDTDTDTDTDADPTDAPEPTGELFPPLEGCATQPSAPLSLGLSRRR